LRRRRIAARLRGARKAVKKLLAIRGNVELDDAFEQFVRLSSFKLKAMSG
jgi:hypothetical protein